MSIMKVIWSLIRLATEFGDYRFNDLFPNFLTQSYTENLRNFYTSFKDKLAEYDLAKLSETDRLNLDILKWECDIGLEGLNFKEELLPINQFASIDLYIATMAAEPTSSLSGMLRTMTTGLKDLMVS